ncbi:hypothetical protein Pmar_PMAR001249 [Perkinsus marinus ATCC 50983]|uniref:RNA-editing substrate-binding complex 6 protein domain-containing protein n=1 Tax=Perkinsus marinus (strain ATCC 50983 / TXsc) TaxID=423536 RepID=C5KTA1_PERM5|nr:hypothetical protein Pmar_PMAR001249 [Perkinsus marinus ATCC 50983]EER12451.1 hypothetical protein Pmar_PMAR001249 [Perkinsus marinus ATCC 50983]|eukprot:XP_002780656.1 hypothetical protein Pmar_PMAR001249 [Perkinsus marinus ATCC 50983]
MALDRSEDVAVAPVAMDKPEPQITTATIDWESLHLYQPEEPDKPKKYRTYGPDEAVPEEEKVYQLRRRRAKKAGHFRINKQILQSETLEELLDVIAEALNWFNIVNIGTALYKLASLALADQSQAAKSKAFLRKDNRYIGFLDEIANVLSYVDEPAGIESGNGSGKLVRDVKSACFSPKELANIVWAVTHIGLPHRRLYELVARHIIWYIDHFDSVNLSLALWGFAKMDVCCPELFRAAASVIIDMIDAFEPHRLCNTAWAFSKTLNAQDNQELFRAIASSSIQKIDKFNLSNESMLVYSFALAHYKEPLELFRMIMKRQIRSIKRGEVNDPRSFANMAWGVAELGFGPDYPDLYVSIADYLARRPKILNEFGINQLATLCLALMMVESNAPQVERKIAQG